MKLKTSTLLALIAAIYFAVITAISIVISFVKDINYENLETFYKIENVFTVIAWIFVANFFLKLFNNQK